MNERNAMTVWYGHGVEMKAIHSSPTIIYPFECGGWLTAVVRLGLAGDRVSSDGVNGVGLTAVTVLSHVGLGPQVSLLPLACLKSLKTKSKSNQHRQMNHDHHFHYQLRMNYFQLNNHCNSY